VRGLNTKAIALKVIDMQAYEGFFPSLADSHICLRSVADLVTAVVSALVGRS
jgi:hypothetical protein